MPPKKQAREADSDAAKRRTAREEARHSESLITQSPPASALRRARLDPASLTPRDVLQLQSTIGNQGVVRLLSGASRHEPSGERKNETGLPDTLKASAEHLSG
ncbi:MAG TPA: hypothetical protein VF754_03970, partial [Pyrinomonadaceae bacterium]